MLEHKKTLFLITLIIIPFISGIFFGFTGALIGFLVLLLVSIFLIIIDADQSILYLYKARPVIAGEVTEFQEHIFMLSKRQGIPVPSIYITETELPGSFIIGRDIHKTSIIIPKRLSTLLKSEEIGAVIAHNIVQIDNTIRKRTIVALIAGALTMSSIAIRWGAVFTGFGDFNDPAPKLFGLFIMGLAAPPAAALIHSLPKEDYDAKAITLWENSEALISAIKRLESNNITGYSSLGFLCVIDPQKETFFEYLLNVHPPIEIRIQKLTRQIL